MLVASSAPAPRAAGQRRGTRSQIVQYFVEGRLAAICHRYLRPDGSLGGRGRADPKWLLVEGEILTAHPERVRCEECERWRRVIDSEP